MRIKVAILSGAVLVLTAGTGAAYAVVGHSSVSPTVTGNTLPIDNNHSSTAHRQPGDDRGRPTAEPGDDRGRATAEPGDDRRAAAEPGDDRKAAAGPGEDRTRGGGTDDAARPTGSASAPSVTAASPSASEDHHRGHDGPGHH